VTLDIEGVVDRSVGGSETVGLTLRLEPLHRSFSSADVRLWAINGGGPTPEIGR
jgi:hypothetical protein